MELLELVLRIWIVLIALTIPATAIALSLRVLLPRRRYPGRDGNRRPVKAAGGE